MRKIITILLILLSLNTFSQNKGLFGFYDKKDKNQFFVICGLQLLSGVSRGYEQVVVYHYSTFKADYPHINDNYFNPQISWKNKYKNQDPNQGPAYFGSTNILVWTTDFKHLMDVVSDVPNYVSITLPLTIQHGKINWKQIVARAITATLIREIGFNTVYSIIYK